MYHNTLVTSALVSTKHSNLKRCCADLSRVSVMNVQGGANFSLAQVCLIAIHRVPAWLELMISPALQRWAAVSTNLAAADSNIRQGQGWARSMFVASQLKISVRCWTWSGITMMEFTGFDCCSSAPIRGCLPILHPSCWLFSCTAVNSPASLFPMSPASVNHSQPPPVQTCFHTHHEVFYLYFILGPSLTASVEIDRQQREGWMA